MRKINGTPDMHNRDRGENIEILKSKDDHKDIRGKRRNSVLEFCFRYLECRRQ